MEEAISSKRLVVKTQESQSSTDESCNQPPPAFKRAVSTCIRRVSHPQYYVFLCSIAIVTSIPLLQTARGKRLRSNAGTLNLEETVASASVNTDFEVCI